MKTRLLTVILFLACFSCHSNNKDLHENDGHVADPEVAFDKTKWEAKEGKDYPFRESMLNDILYGDTVRSQTGDGVLDLLGKPDRTNEDYLYYMIAQKRIGSWPLHTKTLVIKLTENDTVEWIKIHD